MDRRQHAHLTSARARRRALRRGGLAAVALATLSGLATAPATAAAPPTVAVTPAVEAETTPSADALANDLRLVAQSRGWTYAQAAADHRNAEEVGRIAEQVAASRPHAFVGSAVSPDPALPPTLYVKGRADAYVRGLVAHAAVPVVLADGQPYSFEELSARQDRLQRAVRAMGFLDGSMSSGITTHGRIAVLLSRRPGLPGDARAVASRLPSTERRDLTIRFADGPVSRAEHTWGGRQMTNSRYECTSGFSTYDLTTGMTGVSSAYHCSDMTSVLGDMSWLPATYRSGTRGQYGEPAWFSTPEPEYAQFVADVNDIRRVEAVEPYSGISAGETVCLFRRNHGDPVNPTPIRSCSPVKDPSVKCSDAGNWMSNMVLVDDNISEEGDSGGPWSFNNTAFGSLYGVCEYPLDHVKTSAFSAADLYDEAMGVKVRLSHILPTRVALTGDDRLQSTDGRFWARMQSDGNFVIYQSGGVGAIWATNTYGYPGALLTMQSDGNLVLRESNGYARWSTHSSGTGTANYLIMQTDGNLVMYSGPTRVWSSGTCCR